MKIDPQTIEKAKQLYPNWDEQAFKQVEQHFTQVLLRQLEGRNELYTTKQYVIAKKESIEKIWNGIWKYTALQRFSREERYKALEQLYEKDQISTKSQQQDKFIQLLKELIHWSIDDWISIFVQKVDWNQLRKQAEDEHERQKKKFRYQQIQEELTEIAVNLLEQLRQDFYEQAREHIALAFVRDISKHVKRMPPSRRSDYYAPLRKGDPFFLPDYPLFEEFLEEYTGETVSWHWGELRHATYYDRYADILESFLYTSLFQKLSDSLDPAIKTEYQELYHFYHRAHEPEASGYEEFILEDTHEIHVEISDIASELITAMEQEHTDDMLQIAIRTKRGQKLWNDYRRKAAKIEERRKQEQRLMESLFHDEFSFTKAAAQTLYVLHVGPTNSGKTYNALQRLKRAETGIYMAPLRLLALEVYQTLNEDGAPCHLKTGEEERYTNGATVTSCTIEVANLEQTYEVAVIDEAQMIADRERGFSWYRSITKTKAAEVHIILAPHALDVLLHLLDGKQVKILTYSQSVPLVTETIPFQLKKARAGDAIVVFSRSRVLQTAASLEQQGHRVSVIYGNMPPETRQAQMADFLAGNTDIVVSTDAIGMGLNLPIRRVVFLETTKFDGTMRRNLTSQEIKQIGGRAGRKGMYDTGFVAAAENVGLIRKALTAKDTPIESFTIKPTVRMLKEYAAVSHDLTKFFEIWENYKPPAGMIKADLTQEKELYAEIKNTVIVDRLSLPELYRYLSMPFSHYEKDLRNQWKLMLTAIVNDLEIPEPDLSGEDLEHLEQNYKKIGLHLLFLYSLEMRRDAYIWERQRQIVSQQIQSYLKTNLRSHTKTCSSCKKPMALDYPYGMCQSCYKRRRPYYPKHNYGI
ncbi:helicase-related protein [Ectobacillus funiculus]|uniref:helicase-related protein n=1 Tax=Ectobacillus funiculus TaxID=137993 RepID=UPI00397ACBE6